MANGDGGTRAMARWALLCLLAFGVLGMHSLGLGHQDHAPIAAATVNATGGGTLTATDADAAAATAQAVSGVAVTEAGHSSAVIADQHPTGHSSGMAAMCLAILAALTAAIALAGRFPPRQSYDRPAARLRTPVPSWRGPPFSLLVARIAVARI